MDTPTTWVVGSDGSDSSMQALTWAMAHARGRADCIDIVTAWNSAVPIVGFDGEAPSISDAELQAAAETTCRHALAAVGVAPPVPVRATAVRGGSSNVLLDAASTASLLVLGSRGHGGFVRLLLGSTSHQCATHAATPTVVVPDEENTLDTTKILVGFDGSANSMAALHWALDFADPRTSIHVVSAWDTSPLAIGAEQFFFPEATALAEDRFDYLLEQTIAGSLKVAEGDVGAVMREFVNGPPRSVLAERAEHTDLVVVGARGHGAVSAALLGSVSSWLLHHVRRPLVVVPEAPPATMAS